MNSYITADEQSKIRCEIEQIQRSTEEIFLRLNPLDRSDERIIRTEQLLSAVERLLCAMTSGPGRLGPAAMVRPILVPPAVREPEAAAVSNRERRLFLARPRSLKVGLEPGKMACCPQSSELAEVT